MHFSSALFASAFLTLANCALVSRSLSGEATFYGGNVAGGACSFSTYTLPSGIFGTALSDSNWDDAANCGACVAVTGPSGNTITAMIVDECPGCGTNHLDLLPDAFSSLADPSTGVIDVTWDFVECPITSAIQLHNKDGVSAYWFSMQVVNANKGVDSLEVSTDGGNTWQATARQTYNFFENSMGFGTTTVDVKITSVDGDVVIVNSVEVSSGGSVTASGNFASSGTTVAAVSTSEVAKSSSATSTTSEAASKTSELSVSIAQTTLPGAEFQEASTIPTTPVTYAVSTYSPEAIISSAGGVSTASSLSPTSSPALAQGLTTKTKTKTKCPSISPSSSPIALPTSTPKGVFSNATTTAYYTTSVGTLSSTAGGIVSTPTTSSIPFTGSASMTTHKVREVIAAFGFILLVALLS